MRALLLPELGEATGFFVSTGSSGNSVNFTVICCSVRFGVVLYPLIPLGFRGV